MAWFQDHPHYLQDEENALMKEGFTYTIDEAARSEGRLIITIIYPIGSENHDLTCHYHAAYPFFAPKVIAPTLPSGRHIDPYSHGLCLFEDEQSVWNTHDTLAKVLKEQIPKVLKEHEYAENISKIEGAEGYQITGQIPYEPVSVIFTGDWVIPEEVNSGEICIKVTKNSNSGTPVLGFVDSFNAGKTPPQSSSTPFLEDFFPSKLQCKWVKLDGPPKSIKGDDVLNEAKKINPAIKNAHFQKKDFDIVGLVFQEDASKNKKVLNWIFVIRRKIKLNKIQKSNGQKHYVTEIIRSDRYTIENIQQRVPRLRFIADKSVLVIGAGALGSNVIWQLARAGITSITFVDFDFVQAGNIPRWLLGFSAIGKLKTEALKSHLLVNFPNIQCTSYNFHIGAPQNITLEDGSIIDTHEFLMGIIKNSDLVIDCTAETNVNNYLSTFSNINNTPYIWATATQGGWGGIVGRVVPQSTEGDWIDFTYLNKLGEIPIPAAEEGSDIQPVGCFHPTFTGTGFDLDHVSLMATRLSIATLCQGSNEGYPDFDWDVGILHLWDKQTGNPITPHWETNKLHKYTGSRNADFTNTLDQ
ncbi:MAG: ThiF family adenylyltransferase [Cycloclasticus sp.]